jgi:hypothetical protein
MRVVHVAPTPFGTAGLYGGGERYPLELARSIAAEVDTQLVTFEAQPRVVREAGGLPIGSCWKATSLNNSAFGRRFGRLFAELFSEDAVPVTVWAACSADGRAVAAERRRRLPDPYTEYVRTRVPNGSGELVVQPPREDFDGDRLGVDRPDHLQVLIGDLSGDVAQSGIEDVEVTHPALPAQLLTLDDELEAVVVGV